MESDFVLYAPLEPEPVLFFRLVNDVLLQRLSAHSPHGTLTIIVQNGWDLIIPSDVFLGRISE